MSRAICWHTKEPILRGSREGGGPAEGVEGFWGVLQKFTGPFSQNINIFLGSSAQARLIGTLVG